MTELEDYNLKNKIIIYRKLRLRGFYNFIIDLFKDEILKDVYNFSQLKNFISENKIDDANQLIESVYNKIKNTDCKTINHKDKIIFRQSNKAYCTYCDQVVYIVNNFLEAKKRIELNQPIIINEKLFDKELIENLTTNNHNCIIYYSELFEEETIDFENLF